MIVQAARALAMLALRAFLYVGLFVGVVTAHIALTAALRALGWGDGFAVFAAGALVLGIVLVCVRAPWRGPRMRRRRRDRR